MANFKKARMLFTQFLANLPRTLGLPTCEDREHDAPMPSTETVPGMPVSSLSLALGKLGILRSSQDFSAIDSSIH